MYRVKHINTGLLLALLVIGGVSTWLLLDRVDRQLRSAERAAIDDRRRELDTLANALAYLIDINEASIESLRGTAMSSICSNSPTPTRSSAGLPASAATSRWDSGLGSSTPAAA